MCETASGGSFSGGATDLEKDSRETKRHGQAETPGIFTPRQTSDHGADHHFEIKGFAIMQVQPDCLVVAVHTRTELDEALNRAVELLRPVAMTEQVGISVTRLAPGRYEARVNSEVPPGTTTQIWGLSNNDPKSRRQR